MEPPDPFDFDASGKRVTYYPDSLILSHNPHAVFFYRNTKLLHVYIDLRTPPIGRDFTIKDTDYIFTNIAPSITYDTEKHAAITFSSWLHLLDRV